MKCVIGIDLGSTTTKAVILDESGGILGRGITNSRSNYDLAAAVARSEAYTSARFDLLSRAAEEDQVKPTLIERLLRAFRLEQRLHQLRRLRELVLEEVHSGRLGDLAGPTEQKVDIIFERIEKEEEQRFRELDPPRRSAFFRDAAGSAYTRIAEEIGEPGGVSFDILVGLYDKCIIRVENEPLELSFEGHIRSALGRVGKRETLERAVEVAASTGIEEVASVGTGYGRARLPFPREQIRSEILCHGLGAHAMFPGTRTVLDIGGQDTKAIQVDDQGIVTSFQMNDRCAAGCGRYLGYIADEMNIGLHELGPMAEKSTRCVKINSTCTVFAGAELRERLSLGEKREDILAGLHRAIILRAMSLLARSGGVDDEFTFTGGVANNRAAVTALRDLVRENYGRKTLNISPDSIYTGALGAALFAHRMVN
ncbi:MAG: BadF/BadG/BcrA/BcrD ATPase family protein [Acidobacteriota bacterium]|nr:BadF/BadG/BcrA/BcrD ATPase family protein [Acidobacteriota bacterium]MDQ7087603.1 BadF/BadG/BcrA/BcrD ATPase family protein [Acidobacteriota bacterium]